MPHKDKPEVKLIDPQGRGVPSPVAEEKPAAPAKGNAATTEGDE